MIPQTIAEQIHIKVNLITAILNKNKISDHNWQSEFNKLWIYSTEQIKGILHP